MVQELLLVLIGLGGLIFFSSLIVRKAKIIARALRVSELVIGLTVVSIGTSLPEIATNISAAIAIRRGLESSGIAVGNIIGSEVCQITLVLGIIGMIAALQAARKELIRDGIAMVGAIAALWIVSLNGISRVEGMLLVLLYVGYLMFLFFDVKKSGSEPSLETEKDPSSREHEKDRGMHLWKNLFWIIAGSVLLFFSSKLVVENGISVSKAMHVSEYIIGLFVGLSTSLPELSVAVIAVKKKSPDISLGNLLGSNITDPLFSLGIGASISSLAVDSKVLQFDIPFLFIVTLIALFILASKNKLTRCRAAILILFYFGFMMIKISGLS